MVQTLMFLQESFYAWVDIQEFRGIPTADYRRGKSMHIYQKYIREGAVLQVTKKQEIFLWGCCCLATVVSGCTILARNTGRLLRSESAPKARPHIVFALAVVCT